MRGCVMSEFCILAKNGGTGMIYRKLGDSELNCSVVGLGTWGMGGDSWAGSGEADTIFPSRRSARESKQGSI